jgi:Tol biopolymer transport system component
MTMPETKQLLRETRDRIAPPPDVLGGLERRRRHTENVKRFAAAAVAIVVALVGLGGWFVLDRDAAQRPADRSDELGIFAPVAGRIVYVNEAEAGDLGYDPGVWALDPSGPSDTLEGRAVADDIAAALVRLGLEDATPLGWSSDGTELLFSRPDAASAESLFPKEYLYILHADGSETLLNEDPISFGGATISPDGTRVVFAAWGDDLGLWVVDAEGGRPVRLPLPGAEGIVADPTFSPDGTRIAYVDSGELENHLWVMDADGGNAHEILADEATVPGGSLQWSPAGDRIAGVARSSDGDNSIYTFAPDGSDFTPVISGALSPYWSPDGSRIAYDVECELTDVSCGGLAIADADGSNVREFSFAASGPWHPDVEAIDEPTPDETPSPTPTVTDGLLNANGDVLRFTGTPDGASGDLVAVNPATGEDRVIVEDLADVSNARWSADGRWVAFEMTGSLWVVDRTLEPRQVFDAPNEWSWSPTGARLAVFRGSTTLSDHTLSVIDPSTGVETELASIVGDVFSPVWSADETRILFGVRGGTVYSVDVGTGKRSLFVQLPGKNLDSIDKIEWSPDGSRLVILHNGQDLYVLNPDGSDLRALADDVLIFGFDWSPDGSRIAWTEDQGGAFHVVVSPADGSTPTLVASLPNAPANPAWSPDGSQIALGHRNAFLAEGAANLVIDADGSGEAVPLDDLTYESWRGGSYDCDCDLFG